ncbi:LysR family transcriptional regulator [Actinomyces polynesiensis]|uniref:LysR family transcriptional regulator n=1 Tax=Actinomyces polynesiensis TaxID=1325934 RepID=UPI0005B8ADFE|nr:LysR family transcriptional regulator [Actinomyces polynesiensis]
MSVTLAQLRSLVAVVDEDGFAQAAARQGLTQSAVSHAVATLEQELGGPLVSRRPTISVTALGSRVLPHARAAIASADGVSAAAAEFHGRTTGLVRLAAAATVSFGLLPTLLATWRRDHPGIDVQLFEGDDDELPLWLEKGIVDAAVLINPDRVHPDAVEVAHDDYRATLRADHPLAGEGMLAAEELVDDPVLVSAGGCAANVLDIFRSVDPDFRPVQEVRDIGALLGMVAADVGITVFPSIGQGMLPRELVMVPITPTRTRSLVFTGPLSRPWSPLVTALRSSLGPAAN